MYIRQVDASQVSKMVRAAALVVASKRVKGGAALNHKPSCLGLKSTFGENDGLVVPSGLVAALVVASKRIKGGAALNRRPCHRKAGNGSK